MLDEKFLSAARALIAAESVTDRGNLRAVQVLEPLWQEAGLQTTRLPAPDTGERDANLLAGPGGGADARGGPLLLVTHLDTVEPGPRDRWRTDPFAFTIDGPLAHGLGVADVKLDALCKVWAAARLKGVRLSRPFWFLGTYGEEAGLRGARRFVETWPFTPRWVLCGEPSALKINDAHKGYGMVRVTVRARTPEATRGEARRIAFHGKAAHSSTPHLGVNAIDLAIERLSGLHGVFAIRGGSSPNTIPAECLVDVDPALASALGEEGTPIEVGPRVELAPLLARARAVRDAWKEHVAALVPSTDERFEPAGAVANATKIASDGRGLSVVLDARLLPAQDVEVLHAAFQADPRVRDDDDATVEIEILRRANGMSLPPGAELVRVTGRVLARFGLDPAPRAKPTSTEAGTFARAGCEVIVFGPSPSEGNAHTANEFARLDEVERAIDVYEALIRELCG